MRWLACLIAVLSLLVAVYVCLIGAGDFVVAIAGFASFIIWLTLADFWGSGYFGRPDAAADAMVRH